ncbi:MAG TPA: glycine cleavage system protein GcvH [Candidatus Polarisedimenticolia bacterium]|jgi:glycine cleavage system H protein
MYPENLRYTKDHEWIDVKGSDGTVGVTFFAQKELGDVVFVELPDVGRSLAQGEIFGTIESVKAVSEIYSPVSGTVLAVNTDLKDHPEQVNLDPYGAGWMVKIRLANSGEIGGLMESRTYQSLVGGGH